jgi:hypothetical protein
MPKHAFQATAEGLPTRRQFLRKLAVTSAIGAAAGGATLALAKAELPHPDAALLALGEKFKAAWRHERAVCAEEKGVYTDESDERCDAASNATGVIAEEMLVHKACTSEGLAMKALVVSWCHCGEIIEGSSFGFQPTLDSIFAASIIRDLLDVHSADTQRKCLSFPRAF